MSTFDRIMDFLVNQPLTRWIVLEVFIFGLISIAVQISTRRKVIFMSQEFDDLKQVIGDLGGAISRETTAIQAVLDQLTGNVHPSDLKDLTAQIRASVDNINAASTKLEEVVRPGEPPSGPETPETPPEGGTEPGQPTGPGSPETPPEGGGGTEPGQPTGPGV